MPTYEYACKQCGEHLEVVQRFTDEPLTTCPACSGALRKVFGSIGISFKGSGFYKTDSRTSENGSSKKEKESPPSGGDSKPSTSTETTTKAKDTPAKSTGSSTAAAS